MNIPTRKTLLRRASIGAACLFAAAGLCAAIDAALPATHALKLKRDDSAVNRGTIESASFAGVVKQVAPSIVKVTVQINSRRASLSQGEQVIPFGNLDPNLRQFFGNRFPMAP
jgi:S1-C subfamily serine protease